MPLELVHPAFSPPPDDANLWRYVTLTKALSLFLRRSLYFPTVSELRSEDPFEGRSTLLTRQILTRASQDVAFARTLFDNPSGEQPDLTGLARMILDSPERLAPAILANCWHESAHDSAALWKLYSLQGEGVAIRTTFGRLCKALKSDLTIHAGRVSYQDYATSTIKDGNIFYSVMTKRQSFEHEKEVRFVAIDYRKLGPGGRAGEGLLISADPDLYVDEVVISPYFGEWAVETVRETLFAVGCKVNVTQSHLMSLD